MTDIVDHPIYCWPDHLRGTDPFHTHLLLTQPVHDWAIELSFFRGRCCYFTLSEFLDSKEYLHHHKDKTYFINIAYPFDPPVGIFLLFVQE